MKWALALPERALEALLKQAATTAPEVKLLKVGGLLLVCSMALFGCASSPQTSTAIAQSSAPSVPSTGDVALFTSHGPNTSDVERLTRLWHKRTHEGPIVDYPIGPGDVLEISVPAVDELRDRVVRVSGEGVITLPLIGTIRAEGLTEHALHEALQRRLEAYMYAPQMNLFVREYRSRQVAVIGAVTKPGLYTPTTETDTVLDMIASAGGMTPEASARILLIPAERLEPETASEGSARLPLQLVSRDLSPFILKHADPIEIDLKYFNRGGQQRYLPLPVRPGDVIVIPGSGEVMVQGWVEKPGSYKITPALTVLGAVAAAGGPLFAADTSAVRVIRTGKQGEKVSYQADLERIKWGENLDIPVQEGDVIEVSASTSRLVPYGFYRFFSSILNLGVGASVPVR